MTQYETCEGCCDSDFYGAMESRLMAMTFWAHKAVLFEKIKQRIDKEEGEKLEKIAELLVDASKNKWKNRQEAEKKREELRGKLQETLEE